MNKTTLKARVYAFYEKNKHFGKKYIADHFIAENHPKSTVYSHIKSAEEGKPLERKKGMTHLTALSSGISVKGCGCASLTQCHSLERP